MEGVRVTACLVLSAAFGRKIEGNIEGKIILGRRRMQLPDEVNGKISYWNLSSEHQFTLDNSLWKVLWN